MTLLDLVDDTPLLLALCEQLCLSMNGASMRRVRFLFDGLSRSLETIKLNKLDKQWLEEALPNAAANKERWGTELDRLHQAGIEVITSTDTRYPTNLKLVHDGPPLLFVQGDLHGANQRAVAVVGTRNPSHHGIGTAQRIADGLVGLGYTVVSGLAKGIDTAAHVGALKAGGRTVAVFGTPIEQIYPAANRALAQWITEQGACVSQFLPGTDTQRWGFPARNVTTSGLALATVVIEGAEKSGSHQTAKAALNHGKRVFLTGDLMHSQTWAQQMQAGSLNATTIHNAEQIVDILEDDLAVGNDAVFL